MTLCETTNNETGTTRYYVDGRRVTREQFNATKFWRRLDSFISLTRGRLRRIFCEAGP